MIKTPLSTVIGGAFWTPNCTILGSTSKTLNQIIKSLFASNKQGFAYDPNDLTTMFQDAAGTVPVTAMGQAVGLVLDKSKAVPANRRNLLYYTEDFTNVAWVKTGNPSGSPVDNGLVLAPDGTTTARSFTFGAATFIRQNNIPLNSGVIGYQSVWVRKGALSPANAIRLTQNNTLAWNTGGSSKIILTNQWQRISASAAVTGTNVRHIIFGSVDASGANDPDCNGSIEVWHPQYELTGLTDYQKVESNYGGWVAGNHAYQTTSASRPILRQNAVTGANYLEFDGSDDFLVTNSIDFTSTDKISLFAGVRKFSDTTQSVVVELSQNWSTNNGSFSIQAPNLATEQKYAFTTRVSNSIIFDVVGYKAPNSAVISVRNDVIADRIYMKINGSLFSNLVDQGTGNYGNYPLYIGRRGGTSLPFNGHIYSLIGIGRLTTDAETTALEKLIAKNTGVTLSV